MNILVLGGRGFIGRRVVALLQTQGHEVTVPTRREVDFFNLDETRTKACLANQDVVVNCVGIMTRDAAKLETVHHHAPAWLARWAHECSVKTWVQLSALGADAAHEVAFVGSKGRGDFALSSSGLQLNIARPSVVFGRGGESCELFLKLVKLPVIALPDGGKDFMWQPVHVDDVAQGLVNMVNMPLPHGAVVNMVGATQHSVADYLRLLRQRFHHKNHLTVLPIPMAVIAPTLPLMNVLSNGFLGSGSMKLLKAGSCADKSDFAALLGREPLGVCEFAY